MKEAGLDIDVTNRSISNLTEDIDIVITHKDLTPRAKTVVSQPLHLSIDNFMNGAFYDELVEKLKIVIRFLQRKKTMKVQLKKK